MVLIRKQITQIHITPSKNFMKIAERIRIINEKRNAAQNSVIG